MTDTFQKYFGEKTANFSEETTEEEAKSAYDDRATNYDKVFIFFRFIYLFIYLLFSWIANPSTQLFIGVSFHPLTHFCLKICWPDRYR